MPSEMAFQHYDRGALRGGDRRAPPHSTQRALAPSRPPLVPPPPPSPPPVHDWAARPMGPRAVCRVLSGAHDSLIGSNPFVADDGVTREPRRTSFVRGGEAFRALDARAVACVRLCASGVRGSGPSVAAAGDTAPAERSAARRRLITGRAACLRAERRLGHDRFSGSSRRVVGERSIRRAPPPSCRQLEGHLSIPHGSGLRAAVVGPMWLPTNHTSPSAVRRSTILPPFIT